MTMEQDQMNTRSVKPRSRTLKARQFVYVVTYAYDYEGETVEAVYASMKDAREHPGGGDQKIIRRLYVQPERKP